jgi:hypothetical protein
MMADHILFAHAAVVLLALLCTALAQLLSVRLCWCGVVGSLFFGLAVGLVALIAGAACISIQWNDSLSNNLALGAANFVLFVCCWYFYFHFINIGEASLRIRLLREVAENPGRPLEGVLAVYNVSEVVRIRIKRLVGDGQLVETASVYQPGAPRMVLVAKAFAVLRWLLLDKLPDQPSLPR